MSILAFLAIIAACVTPIVITYILVHGLTRSSREEALRQKVNQWGDDIKSRLVDIEVSFGHLRDDWKKYKEGK